MRMPASVVAVVSIVLSLAPAGAAPAAEKAAGAEKADRPPIFSGMGKHHREVTTTSKPAQRYFDQALTWTFAFNHDEAIRSYREAARLDEKLAMAWWGIALANGPHINNPAMSPEASAAAWEALTKARALADAASPIERELIEALGARYAEKAPDDRHALDAAYAAAMREVWKRHQDDADVGTLFAESLMDLRPWDLWSVDGVPRPETPEILATLEAVMKLAPEHPGANHLYIHAIEASNEPSKGDASAEVLRRLVPASGHLVHMPSHIDIRTGRWGLAATANERAIEADRKYREISPKQGFYNVYMAHDHQFLAFVAMMQGRDDLAITQAREMVAGVPPEFLANATEFVDAPLALPYEVLIRFGRWKEMLAEPRPDGRLLIATALWHHARAISLAATRRVPEAIQEQQLFRAALTLVPQGRRAMNNDAHALLSVADHVLAGEIAFAQGDLEGAISELRLASKEEDALTYDEPPDWVLPVRHALGAVLLAARKEKEAETAYLEDLRRWPENGWSLYGLQQAVARQKGRAAEAREIGARFEKAWSSSTFPIAASCACAAPRTASDR